MYVSNTEQWLEWATELDVVLLALDDCDLECDGMTTVISHALGAAGIEHTSLCGFAKDLAGGDIVMPHCWIELEGGWIIDYRLRMWLGDHERIPHGVFHSENSGFEYQGHPMRAAGYSLTMLHELTDGQIAKVRVPPLPETADGTP